jgi:microcystin-dependent protein
MAISLEADSTLPQGYIKVNGTTAATLTANGIVSGGVPAGAVMSFAMNSAPAGWLACNGAAVNRTGTTGYAALFAAIGTTYGAGNGSTTFNLPDLRGYFVRGVGVAGQNGTNSDGTASGAFGVKQADEFKSHQHTSGYQIVTTGGYGSNNGGSFATSTGTGTNTNAIGGTETRPKNIALLYCIKH